MRVSLKLDLIDKVGRELQARYSFDEIDQFLTAFDVQTIPPSIRTTNSKWLYAKDNLKGVSDTTLIRIAAELDLEPSQVPAQLEVPRNWRDTKGLRLFISHISLEKVKATRLKECLAPFQIAGFVAHEDIHPTLEWQVEIERALHTMEAFVAMHTKGFAQSIWTQQEIGFAVAKGVKIISLKMGEDPTGFISKHQALPRGNKTAEEIAIEVHRLLADDARTQSRMLELGAPQRPMDDAEF